MAQAQVQTKPEIPDPLQQIEEEKPTMEDAGDHREAGTVYRRPDGKYEWNYAMDMHQDHMMFEIPLIAVGILMAIILLVLMPLILNDFDLGMFMVVLGTFAVIFLITMGAGWLVCAMYHWVYWMNFVMDEECIIMTPSESEQKTNEQIAKVTALTGALTHNYGAMAAGAANANGTAAKSNFRNVSGITGDPNRHRIILRSVLFFNYIYVTDEYYDFVWDYITERCPKARISSR